MYLIRPEQKDSLRLLVENSILHHHLVCFGDFKHVLGKFQIIGNRFIVGVLPTGKEFFIKIFRTGGSKIFRIDRIGNNKHLNSRENARKLALTDIFAYLTETVKIRVLTVFQLDMYKRYTVYQQRHIKAAVLAVNIVLVIVL